MKNFLNQFGKRLIKGINYNGPQSLMSSAATPTGKSTAGKEKLTL